MSPRPRAYFFTLAHPYSSESSLYTISSPLLLLAIAYTFLYFVPIRSLSDAPPRHEVSGVYY